MVFSFRSSVFAALLTGCFVACSPEDGDSLPVPDAGTEAGFQVVPPALPAEPALPVFTPCPAGWRTVGTAPALCEPWPETGMAACTSDTAHFPGQPSCARVGTACPTGEWDDNFPTGKTVRFVRASAAPGGTGSRAAPFASLAEALTQAQPGDIVALGKGTYTTQTAVPREVTLWGACVAQTTVQRAAGSSVEGVVTSRSAGVAVKNLRITGPGVGLLALGRQAQLDAEDVVIEGASEVGWSSESGAQSTGRRVVIRHTTLGTAVAYEGAGIQVTLGSSLDASSVVLDGNRSSGLALDGAGTRVTLSDVAIVNTLPTPKDNTAGRGVLCQSGALLTLQRAVIEKNHHYGLRLVQAKAQLTDVLVRETTPRVSDNAVGAGLYALNGELTAQRTRSDGNQGVGIWLRDPDSRGVLKDVVMQENRGEKATASGPGLTVSGGAQASAERAFLARNQTVGLEVAMQNTHVTLTDTVVVDTLPDVNKEGGYGIFVHAQANATLTRGRFERNHATGLAFSGSAPAQLNDVVVRETQEDAKANATALLLADGAVTEMNRLLLDKNAVRGFLVSGANTQLTVNDATVRGTLPDSKWGFDGTGAVIADHARLVGARWAFQHNKSTGLIVGEQATVDATEVSVTDTSRAPCYLAPDCDGLLTMGIVAIDGGRATLQRFIIARNEGVGIALADGGEFDLTDGEIAQHAVGANIVSETFDVGRISERVNYRDNGQKLSASIVPLPKVPVSPAL